MLAKCISALFILVLSHGLVHAKTSAVLVYAADLPIIGAKTHGDYAELATLVKHTRADADSTPHFFLFGGASLAPSPLASFDSGSHIVDILNMIEPDVMSVAKREFSYFEDELTLRSYEAAFPFLLSNAVDKETGEYLDGVLPQLLLTKKGISIGLLSILHPRVSEEYLLQRLMIQNPKNTVIRLAEQLRKDGADIIVLLHSDHFAFLNEMLEAKTVDLAIQSEPHDNSKQDAENANHPNRVLINELGTAAVIQVNQSSDGITADVNLIELATQGAEQEVAETIVRYKSRLERQLKRPIGQVSTSFDTIREHVRTRENGFANLITDAMRIEAKTEIALINGGIIRGNQHYDTQHEFQYGDLLDELPFRTRMIVLDVTGDQLKTALENGASEIESNKGKFAQVSGLSYGVDLNQPAGNRVRDIRINNQPLEISKIYSLATTDYLANGGDGYLSLQQAIQRFDKSPTSPLISEVLSRYLSRTKTVSPYTDGRIEIIDLEVE